MQRILANKAQPILTSLPFFYVSLQTSIRDTIFMSGRSGGRLGAALSGSLDVFFAGLAYY